MYWIKIIFFSFLLLWIFSTIEDNYLKRSEKNTKGSFMQKLSFSLKLFGILLFIYALSDFDHIFLFDIFCVVCFLATTMEIYFCNEEKKYNQFSYFLIFLSFLAFVFIPLIYGNNSTYEKYLFIAIVAVFMDSSMSIIGRFFVYRLKCENIKMRYPDWISPNKTFLAVILAMFINIYIFHLIIEVPIYAVVTICLSVALGDAIFAIYKRSVKINDYSHLLGPIGGFCDRFNGWIFAFCIMEILYWKKP